MPARKSQPAEPIDAPAAPEESTADEAKICANCGAPAVTGTEPGGANVIYFCGRHVPRGNFR